MARDWEKVGKIVEKIRELGLSFKEGADHFGIKPWIVYEYNRKRNLQARQAGDGKLVQRGTGSKKATAASAKQRPQKETSNETGAEFPDQVKDLIVAYRRKNPTEGFKRIQDVLKAKYLLVVSRKHIRKVLKDAGLLESCDSSFDKKGPAKGARRFEAKRPGEMWQMDVAYVYLRKIPVLYLVVIIDDHSRYCVAAKLCRNQQAETLIAVLHHAVLEHGRPEKLLSDQGSGFYSWSGEQTRFEEYLDDQEIEHLVAEPHSPQTQGKVERLIQTIRKELLRKVKFASFAEAQSQIQSFVQRYNLERPHQGIQGKRPADRFHGVVGDVERAESELAGPDLDRSRGYVVCKAGDHRVCVLVTADGLKVYLDGKRLKEESDGR
jgi:transposase InsO family protein